MTLTSLRNYCNIQYM